MGSSNSKRHSGTTFGRHNAHPPTTSKAGSGSLRRRGKRNVTLVAACQTDLTRTPPHSHSTSFDRSDTAHDVDTTTAANADAAVPPTAATATLGHTSLAIITDIKGIPTSCPSFATNMTGLIRIYLPSSLGTNSLQSAIDLLIQPVEPSAGSKMPAFTFRPVPKSSIPSMDAPHVLMDYVSLRKLVAMRKEMLITQNANGERNSAATEPSPLETERADIHSPTLPPELDLGLDADGQELVWMMEVASSESGDSAVMSGCGCSESLHAGDAQVHDEERVPKFVEVVEDDVTPMAAGEPVSSHSHRNTTVFESLTELDALPPLPDSPASSIFCNELHVPIPLPDPGSPIRAIDSEPTAPVQLTEPHPATANAPRTSNATIASSPILKETDLTPMASPTIGAIERHDRPESPLSPGDEALAIDTPTTEGTQALASRAVSEVQADHGRVESQLPATASAVEAAPLMPRAIPEPLSPAAQTSAAALPPVFRVGSDSAMSLSMTLPASADGSTSVPLRDSIDLGSSTMRTTKSSKSSLFKRFSQSFSTLTRASKHDKPRDEVVVPPTRTAPASSLSMSRSVDLIPSSPPAGTVAPAISQPPAHAEESAKVVKKKSKLFSSLFGGKGHDHAEEKAAKKERREQERAEKAEGGKTSRQGSHLVNRWFLLSVLLSTRCLSATLPHLSS